MSSNMAVRGEVIRLYKGAANQPAPEAYSQAAELLHMGKDYPLGYDYFRPRLYKAFSAKAGLRDEAEIRKAIAQAEYVKKEIEALYVYYLKRYRTLRKRYSS